MDRSIGQVTTAWVRCVRVLRWVDEALDVASPIVTGMLLLGVASLGWMALDNKSPFEVIHVEPAIAAPGESVTITARVRRDIDRNCSCDMRRALYDGAGVRHDDPTDYRFSANSIRTMAETSPGVLKVKIRVPLDAAPGVGRVESDLAYRCPGNLVHLAWPIRTLAVMPITIVPAK